MMGKEERREGRNSGREEGKETAIRERGRHKKKIIADAYTQRSPAKSLISSSSHAPLLFPLLAPSYSPPLRSSRTPTLCTLRMFIILSLLGRLPPRNTPNELITSHWMNSVPWRLLLNRN